MCSAAVRIFIQFVYILYNIKYLTVISDIIFSLSTINIEQPFITVQQQCELLRSSVWTNRRRYKICYKCDNNQFITINSTISSHIIHFIAQFYLFGIRVTTSPILQVTDNIRDHDRQPGTSQSKLSAHSRYIIADFLDGNNPIYLNWFLVPAHIIS